MLGTKAGGVRLTDGQKLEVIKVKGNKVRARFQQGNSVAAATAGSLRFSNLSLSQKLSTKPPLLFVHGSYHAGRVGPAAGWPLLLLREILLAAVSLTVC